ncbi:MAG: Hsp20/alpha crystallin family protein [Chloroflexi bacterium]|nr:Hsp20/alpha crystallin family protein [Chloroflexota bacterium]
MLRSRSGPPNDLELLQHEMERFLEHVNACKRQTFGFSPGSWRPPVDIYETAGEVVVLAEIAGVQAVAMRITVEGDTLTIAGTRSCKGPVPGQTYHQLEVPFGSFQRTVILPANVNADEAKASYQDGFLEITLPKAAVPQPQTVRVRTTE